MTSHADSFHGVANIDVSNRTTAIFESPHIGHAGVFLRGYLALRIVNRSAGADVLFKRLIEEGGTAGQLYGLVGVYRTDP